MINLNERDRELERTSLSIFSNWPRTKIIFGNKMIIDTGKYALKFGNNALVVIGGGSIKQNKILDKLIDSLNRYKIKYDIYEGVEPNPSKETVHSIAEKYNSSSYDVAIGLGGGSVLDATKAALILTTAKEKDISKFFGVDKVSEKIKRISPCICIPTTAGTSSEISRYANITVKELSVKKLISDIAIHPHFAIVDPELTISCSKDLTITVGLDSLTHSMEGYLNTVQDEGNNDINERALISIEIIFKWLKVAAEQPNNLEARKMMSIACLLGGTIIGGERFKGTGGPHMNSFSWAETIPHGKATGIMLPYYIIYYAKNPKVKEKLIQISKILKIKVYDTENIGKIIAEYILNWYKSLGFPTSLKELTGWKEDYIEKALKDAKENEMKLKAMPNPVPLEKVNELLRPILEAARDGNLDLIK